MTRKRNRLAAVTFDAGNTLLYCDPNPSEIYAAQLSRLGRPVRAEEVGPVFQQAWTEMQSRTSPGQDRYNSAAGGERAWWGEFVKEVLGRLNHDAPWELLLDDLYAAFSDDGVWRVFPETTTTLSKLRTRGLALAIISNWDRRLPDILRSLDLFDWFEIITVSAVEGVEKPSPEIFQRTSNRLGVDPSSTLHVGDSPLEDYVGARNAGFAAVLIDRHNLFIDQPYRRVKSLGEVLDLLDREFCRHSNA
jgi:putative hydrolase of the HAD superfamily